MDNIGSWLLNLSTLKYMVQSTVLSTVLCVLSEELHALRNQQTPTLAAQHSSMIKTNRQEVVHHVMTTWHAFRCLFYQYDIKHNNSYFVCFYVYDKVTMGWSLICLDWALMATSVLLSVMMLLRPPPSPSPWANPPLLLLSLALFQSLRLSPPPRQLGHPGLQERVSPWWNRGRQLFLQPQGHYLKSDRDSSEWTWERWGRREGEEGGREKREREWERHSGKKEGGGMGGGSVVQVYCPAEGEGAGRQMNPAGIWYTPEIAYRSRSQYSGRPERGLRIFWGS